jgi:hypothetical protein
VTPRRRSRPKIAFPGVARVRGKPRKSALGDAPRPSRRDTPPPPPPFELEHDGTRPVRPNERDDD